MKNTGKRPKAAPWRAASSDRRSGIDHPSVAAASAEASPRPAAWCTFMRRSARQMKTTTSGTAAAAADKAMPPRGDGF